MYQPEGEFMEDVERSAKPFNINALNAVFLLGTPPLALIGAIWHGYTFGITWVEGAIFFVWYFACGLSITVGYHRLFTHRSHEARWPLRLGYAMFGAGSFQNSILEWSSDHRRHHKDTDLISDPYNASRGFWWSHFLWIIFDEHSGEPDYSNVRDLQKDWVVRFQHQFIFTIGFLVGMVAPGLVGYAIGGLGTGIGGFVWGGLVRTVFVHHGTFLINSAAHVWGKQPYTTENSSKDSFWLAFFTFGEGYHNFHHTFQADYRNGHRWWQWDPSKWWIKAFSLIKLNDGLKRTPKWAIESARMETKFQKAAVDSAQLHGDSEMGLFQARSKQCCEGLRLAMRQVDGMRQQLKRASAEKRRQLVGQIRQGKESVRLVRDEFTRLLEEMCLATAPVLA
jgi:stearoyl-CoA desaturase (delta-9 desaturase)